MPACQKPTLQTFQLIQLQRRDSRNEVFHSSLSMKWNFIPRLAWGDFSRSTWRELSLQLSLKWSFLRFKDQWSEFDWIYFLHFSFNTRWGHARFTNQNVPSTFLWNFRKKLKQNVWNISHDHVLWYWPPCQCLYCKAYKSWWLCIYKLHLQ